MKTLPLLMAPLVALVVTPPAAAQPSPSPTRTPIRDCAEGAPVRPFDSTITAQQQVDVTALTASGTRIDLIASDQQAGRRTIRTAVADDQGQVSFGIRPIVNTTLYAQQTPEPCTNSSFGETSARVAVRTALSLGAVRAGLRDYAFTGRAFPARQGQVVRLFRRTSEGREVLTATASVMSDGTWRIGRRFTGSGRFDFVARTAADDLNAGGTSNIRLTLIY